MENVAQEQRTKGKGKWTKFADIYTRQLSLIEHYPHPETIEDELNENQIPPSIKYIIANKSYNNFYRWGINGGAVGNHRIIFALHNFSKVILLYQFDKQYNGLIKREHIQPAEEVYEEYSNIDPPLY
ncbi:hypothetical protein [Salisediminibacterium beveridgei]|uniref:Uncharacterized protein n=1 Tax=Salisediminibacterium beveridgei TaxID=632773 RepID=A0A1D7QRK4_9BACI|nr:hypothetical protein [Salisediminibacterium beveridgei]AOM81631.1 hypothetical protein BBEV_0237 [Salisediminibacterium beveridgei]